MAMMRTADAHRRHEALHVCQGAYGDRAGSIKFKSPVARAAHVRRAKRIAATLADGNSSSDSVGVAAMVDEEALLTAADSASRHA